jgi:hypothetical protein
MARSLTCSFVLAGVASLPGALVSQTQIAVPAQAAVAEGHQTLALPFGYAGFRTQLVVDPAAISPGGALLNGIRFRVDRYGAPSTASVVQNVTVRLSHTTRTLALVSTTFANNETETPVIVYQGSVSVPGYSDRPAGARPWAIEVLFPTPFVYTAAQGRLLIDIEAAGTNPPGPGGTVPTCFVDAAEPGGSAGNFGEQGGGATVSNDLRLRVTTSTGGSPITLSLGNTVDFVSTLILPPRPGVFAIGTSALATPVDLTAIGAPHNSLFIAPEVIVPLNWSPSLIGSFASVPLAVPSNPALLDALLYGQSAIFDPTANQLGLLVCEPVEVRIGDPNEPSLVRQVDATDFAATAGAIVNFGSFSAPRYAAAVFQLDGIFF